MALVLPAVVATMGCGGGSDDRDSVFYKATGSLQCSPSLMTQARLDEEASALRVAGATVISSGCAADGRGYPAVCGGGTGELFSVTVSPGSVSVVRRAGFTAATAFADAQSIACR